MQASVDLWDDFDVPTAFLSENDEHVLFDLVEYVNTLDDPCPAWLKQKLAEISNKSSGVGKSSKGTTLPDLSIPVPTKADLCVSPPKECYSSSAESHSRSHSPPRECNNKVVTDNKPISSLNECYANFQAQANRPSTVPQRLQGNSIPLLPSSLRVTEELPFTDQWVLQQHQQLAVNLNYYAKGHDKQMKEIQQKKTKLREDFENNMHCLQEWEQSIIDFDKVVRANFVQEAKRLREIEQHLKETAALLKVTRQPMSSTSSEYVNSRESPALSSNGCCDESLDETSHLSYSISLPGAEANHPMIEDNSVKYCVTQNKSSIPSQYSAQFSPRLIPVREVPSEVCSSASNGSQESLTSETDSESDGLSSLEQCQEDSYHPVPSHIADHPNQSHSGYASSSQTYLDHSYPYPQQQIQVSSSSHPRVVPNQPNVPVIQPCPVILCGSAHTPKSSISYVPVHPCGNQVATTPSLEQLNGSGLV